MKIALIGGDGSGKSTFAHKLKYGHFARLYEATSWPTKIDIGGGITLVDFPGQDVIQEYEEQYVKDLMECDGIIAIYDCSSKNSYRRTYEFLKWAVHHKPEISVLLVSNKHDINKVKVSAGSQISVKEQSSEELMELVEAL